MTEAASETTCSPPSRWKDLIRLRVEFFFQWCGKLYFYKTGFFWKIRLLQQVRVLFGCTGNSIAALLLFIAFYDDSALGNAIQRPRTVFSTTKSKNMHKKTPADGIRVKKQVLRQDAMILRFGREIFSFLKSKAKVTERRFICFSTTPATDVVFPSWTTTFCLWDVITFVAICLRTLVMAFGGLLTCRISLKRGRFRYSSRGRWRGLDIQGSMAWHLRLLRS